MNLTMDRAPALAAISRIAGIVEKRHTIPILANVVLSGSKGRLSLRGTDLEMEAIETFEGITSETGEITMPADKLLDILRTSDPGAQVSVAIEGTDPRAKVKAARSNFRVPCLPANGFPVFNADGFGDEFALPAKLLADMLSRVSWAVRRGPDAGDSILGNVFLATIGSELHVVGCANSGVCLRREPAPEGVQISALLPMKFVGQATKMLADAEGDVLIAKSENLIRIRHQGSQLTSKLFASPHFVNYSQILLDSHDIIVATDQDAMKSALRRVLIMADAKTHAVSLTFTEGAILVKARNDQAGEGADEIACNYEGDEVTILLSADQLDSALTNLKGDVLEIGFAPKAVERDVRSIAVLIRAPADPAFAVTLAQPRA